MNNHQFDGQKYEEVKEKVKEYFQCTNIRVLDEGACTTCEYQFDRLNVYLNKNGYITMISKG